MNDRDGGPAWMGALASDSDAARWDRIAKLARILDSSFRVPGTSWRYGVDGLIGLIPGVGDTVSAALSGWIIWQGYRLGARKRTVARMIGNALIDYAVGSVPLAGDLFDFAFKANRKNIGLLSADLGKEIQPEHGKRTR